MKSCFVMVTVWRKTYVGEPRPGAIVDLVEFEGGVTNDGTGKVCVSVLAED